MQSLNHFLAFTIIILLLRLERKYSKTNKEINSYRFKLCNLANLQKIQVSSSLRLSQECSKSEGFLTLLSWAESKATYMSTAAKIPCWTCTPRTKKKINQKCKLKQRITYRPSLATAPKFYWGLTCTQEYRISELRIKSASTQCYRNSKWICG